MAVSAGGSMVGSVAQRLSQQSFETWEEVELEDERWKSGKTWVSGLGLGRQFHLAAPAELAWLVF